MDWKLCLSHQIWPAIQKGWQDKDRPIHFFWGLAGKNIELIKECIIKEEEWWYVDVGYITQQIQRYPEPKILDYDKTYFRIVKGAIHTTKGAVGNGQRLTKIRQQGIDADFKGWHTGETKHVLICPSSQTVTLHMNDLNQNDWIEGIKTELQKYTNREIRVRNKPRPGNEFWNTDIKDDLKDCHCVVTNMSLSAIDAILNMVPVIADQRNCVWPISSRNLKFVEKPFRAGRKTVEEWLKYITEHQFTIEEIQNGTAYHTLKFQYESTKK